MSEPVSSLAIVQTPHPEPLQSGPRIARLPRCAVIGDEALVARTVTQIQEILNSTVALGMEEVGNVVLSNFFDDDPGLYFRSARRKHASLRLLEDRCGTYEIGVNRTFLCNALRLAAVCRVLPADAAFRQLGPSHRVELLSLGDADKMEELARKACTRKLTVRKLRDAIGDERERHKSTRGRKPTPPLLRALNACLRILRDDSTKRLAYHREHVESLTPPQLKEARAAVDSLSKRIEELLKLV